MAAVRGNGASAVRPERKSTTDLAWEGVRDGFLKAVAVKLGLKDKKSISQADDERSIPDME